MTNKCYYLKNVTRLKKGQKHSVIPFKLNEILIGRNHESTYIIDDLSISRTHALFKLSEDTGSWTVQNKSSSGLKVDAEQILQDSEVTIKEGSIIQFGQSDSFIYKFGMKKLKTWTKPELCEESSSSSKENLNSQQAALELRLQESETIQRSLLNDKLQIQESLERERRELQEQFNKELEELEEKYKEGVIVQKKVSEEKEKLAEKLQQKVTEMQQRIEKEKFSLEKKLHKEEKIRQTLLEEKDQVVFCLQEEKKELEKRLAEERLVMEKRLNDEHQQFKEKLLLLKEQQMQLEQKVQEKELSLLQKEEIQRKQEQDQRKNSEMLLDEKKQLMSRLHEVESTLEEKILLTSTLTMELKEKEETEKKLLSLQEEKKKLETKLLEAVKEGNKISHLEDALNLLEAQKMSLELDAATAATVSEDVRKQVVENVSSVIENELQCPICNEPFVTAIILNCSHVFCKFCIDSWKKTKNDCPNCRSAITSESRAYVLDNFIEKIVLTLSEDMKKRRQQMISERAAEEEAAKLALAAAAVTRETASHSNRRGRQNNRRGGRGGRGGYNNYQYAAWPVQNHANYYIARPDNYYGQRIHNSNMHATVSGQIRSVYYVRRGNNSTPIYRLSNPGQSYQMRIPNLLPGNAVSAGVIPTAQGPRPAVITSSMRHH